MQSPSTHPDQPGIARHPLVPPDEPYAYRSDPSAWQHEPHGNHRAQQLAKALGWLSIGLGIVQLLAPRAVARATGVAERPVLLRALGAREIASGVGILSQREPAGWLWSRVAGDAMDLALLGVAANARGSRRNRVAIATAAVAGVAALDVLSSVQHSRRGANGVLGSGIVHVDTSLTINRPADECYRFWRDFQNFPRFMKHVESVRETGDNRSHWTVRAPAGGSVEWDSEITEDRPGELMAWQSVGASEIEHAGRVRFERAPGDRGTIVRVELQYRPPGGQAGALIAKLFGEEPAQQIDDDLRRFKQLIETGEITTTAGQPAGPRGTVARLLRKGVPG